MTESSLRTLASELDNLVSAGSFVYETIDGIIISELSASMAREVVQGFANVSWHSVIFDNAGTEAEFEDINDDFGPYRVTADKPSQRAGAILLLTASGFRDWLVSQAEAIVVSVVGLDEVIATEGTKFIPAEMDAAGVVNVEPMRSPRTLVREYDGKRVVPQSIGRWLLLDPETWHESIRFQQWAEQAIRAILISLANEIDPNESELVYKGPPRLGLPMPAANADLLVELGRQGFADLQATGRWVFELEREVEMRHSLFSVELARTGGNQTDAIICAKENIGMALDSAKIAYQMSLAKVSAENLKALADLRKAVTDETGKITDATRQVVTAVASALAIGIGLIAARVAANAPPILIVAVMAIVCAYIFVVIYSGQNFVALQRELRDLWRNQIYRFLSEKDYSKLVVQPSRKAEKILGVVSWVGGVAVTIIFLIAIRVAVLPAEDAVLSKSRGVLAPIPSSPSTKDMEPTATPEAESEQGGTSEKASIVPLSPQASPEPDSQLQPSSDQVD